MEKLIKEHILQELVYTEIKFKDFKTKIINDKFIKEIVSTFSISTDLVFTYLTEIIPNFIIDKTDNIYSIYLEMPDLFNNDNNIQGIIAELKEIKLNYVHEQNYAMAAKIRDIEKMLIEAVGNQIMVYGKTY